MKRIILLAVVVLMTATSCVKKDDFKVISFDGATPQSATRLDLHFTVENRTRKHIMVENIDFDVTNGRKTVLKIRSVEPVRIDKKSVSTITVPLRLKIEDPLAIISIAMDGDIEGLYISGSTDVKFGSVRKKFNVPLSSIKENLLNFGIDTDELYDKLDI